MILHDKANAIQVTRIEALQKQGGRNKILQAIGICLPGTPKGKADRQKTT